MPHQNVWDEGLTLEPGLRDGPEACFEWVGIHAFDPDPEKRKTE